MTKKKTFINNSVSGKKENSNTKSLLKALSKEQAEIVNALDEDDGKYDYHYNYWYEDYDADWRVAFNKPYNLQSNQAGEEVKKTVEEPAIKVKWEDKAILEYAKARVRYDGEFAFVVAFEASDNLVIIKDIELINEDTQNGVFVSVDCEKYADALKVLSMRYDDDNTKFAHGHSHCFMPTTPSDTDTNTAKELAIKWDVKELTMFIVNDRFETTCLYASKHSVMGYSFKSKLLQHEEFIKPNSKEAKCAEVNSY